LYKYLLLVSTQVALVPVSSTNNNSNIKSNC